jgi:Xaa-Pro aminopeptidase
MNSHRVAKVRDSLAGLGVDALVLTNTANRRWATGFTSGGGTAFTTDVAIVTAERVDLLVSPIHVEWARGESTVATSVESHGGQFTKSLAAMCSGSGFRAVAVESDALPYPEANSLHELLDDVQVIHVTGLRDRWRAAKDDDEIAALSAAVALTDDVFNRLLDYIRPGMTEQELARWTSARLIESGDGLAFDVIVASGPNAARPHHRAGPRPIERNEPVIIDMGARIQGYCGDLTRTLWLGEPDARFREMYAAILRAQETTKATMSSGTPVRDVVIAADSVLQEAGFGEYILHSVGHGLGLEIHESPTMKRDLDTTLPLNGVVTVEPGLYVPGWGGIRVEDVVVVGETGCRTLTTAPKLTFD